MLEEWNERCGDGDELLGADVNVVDFSLWHEHEVAGLTGIDELSDDAEFLIELYVGLRDDVLVLFPRRKIEAERLPIDLALFAVFEVSVRLDDLVLLHVVTHAVVTVA